MQLIFDEKRVQEVVSAPALQPFSPAAMTFLQDLSEELRARGREYPDVMALAFWCRRASLVKARERYAGMDQRRGRGLAFHIAPGNVPLLFAYSLAAGLLAGCKNIVRLSGREYPQASLVTELVSSLIQERHPELKDYIYLLRYGHDDEMTGRLSAMADVRLIWGGDETIRRIRAIPAKPKAREICFGDRCGICVISAADYLREENKDLLIRRFFNDTYVFDQNACTSPCAVIWTGDEADLAAEDFWRRLGEIAEKGYHPEPAQITGKLAAFLEAAALKPLRLKTSLYKPKLIVAELAGSDERVLEHKYHSGYFYEYQAEDLREILPLCTDRCGTITYFGGIAGQLQQIAAESGFTKTGRIVPVGTAMDFSLVWDGNDLITEMSELCPDSHES